jgi:hypothetical protein
MTAVAERAGARDAAMDTNQLLRRYGNALIVVALAIVDAVVIWRFGVAPGVLLLAAAAMLLVVTLLFRAVQAATGELDEEDALDLARAPTAAEEQKRAAIQALKDLEYERSVGKISKEDFDALVSRYRGEAKRLMRTVDEERASLRGEAEKLAEAAIREALGSAQRPPEPERGRVEETTVSAKKGAKKAVVEADAGSEAAEAADAVPSKDDAKAATLTVTCAACDTKNDGDARFCKKCGGKLGENAPAPTRSVGPAPETTVEGVARVVSDELKNRASNAVSDALSDALADALSHDDKEGR